MSRPNNIGRAGFSLLELSIVVMIILILVALSVPAIARYRSYAQRVQCMANLRSLSAAAELYVQRNGSWPQIPVPSSDSDEDDQAYAKNWIAALAPFGVTQKSWVCPTVQNLLGNPELSKPENVRVDYIASTFDDKPTTPHQWPRQPWFAEVGNVHGNGNLVIFTDGSISDLNSLKKKP